MKIRMMIELDCEQAPATKEEKQWFMEEVLLDPKGLILHSNEIGDTVGTVNVLEVHPF
jgi:hypothetical protein